MPRLRARAPRRRRVPGAERAFAAFLETVRRLRDPDGCPWDRAQTPASYRPALIEEAYEAGEAIAARDSAHTCEELGDLIMVALAVGIIHEQRGDFTLAQVFDEIRAKLIRRHPHVFSTVKVKDADEVITNWNRIKEQEKAAKGVAHATLKLPKGLPGLLLARRLDERLEKLDLPRPRPRRRKLTRAQLAHELFALVQQARAAKLDAESALRDQCGKLARAAARRRRHG